MTPSPETRRQAGDVGNSSTTAAHPWVPLTTSRSAAGQAAPWIKHARLFGDPRSVYETAEGELPARALGYLASQLRKTKPIKDSGGYWTGELHRKWNPWPRFRLTEAERDRLAQRLLDDGADFKVVAAYVGQSVSWVQRFARGSDGESPKKPDSARGTALRSRDIEPGQRHGRLSIRAVSRNARNLLVATCDCDCGATVDLLAGNVARGRSRSCGCLKREMHRKRMRDAGLKTPADHADVVARLKER